LNNPVKPVPPRMIASLVEGFNSIAGKVYIILFPVGLDLLLWFGPFVRVKNLLLPALKQAAEISAYAYGSESASIIEASNQMWALLLDGFNALFGIRTLPVGIPSLMISKGAVSNPLGTHIFFEIPTLEMALGLTLFVFLVGIAAGSLFYSLVAGTVLGSDEPLKMGNLTRQSVQSLLLSMILFLTVALLGIPVMCLISSLVMLLPSLGTLPVMIAGFLLVWVLVPLAFSPHGIFARQMNVGKSIVTSVRMVGGLMAPTGTFFILIILLSYGMDTLWSTPSPDSWMMFVGIIGHAFISTGLLAASFVYYRNGMEWLCAMQCEKDNTAQSAAS